MKNVMKLILADWHIFESVEGKSPEEILEDILSEMIFLDFPNDIFKKLKDFILDGKYESDGGSLCVEVEVIYVATREVIYKDDLGIVQKRPIPKGEGFRFPISGNQRNVLYCDGVAEIIKEEHWYEVLEWGDLTQISGPLVKIG